MIVSSGLTESAALAYVLLEKIGQKKVSVLIDSVDDFGLKGFPIVKESVSGVGDEAHFVVCTPSRVKRTAPLYVKAGSKDLIVQLDIEPPDAEAAMRPKAIAIAKAAAAKLR